MNEYTMCRKNVIIRNSRIRTVILLTILALSAATLNAQNTAYLHGGLGLSTVRPAFAGVDFNKLNVLLGAGLMFPTGDDHFYFGMEGNLAQKGNRTVNPTPGVMAEQTRANLFYLQVPVYAAFRLDKHWSFFMGPALGVLLYNSEENLFTINTTPTNFTTFELSALAGAKYEFGERWGAMIRFEHSILSVMAVEPALRQLRAARRFHAVAGFSLFYKLN